MYLNMCAINYKYIGWVKDKSSESLNRDPNQIPFHVTVSD